MDYSSWLTVSGFSMTLLALFMNEIFNKISANSKEEHEKYFYPALGGVVGTLTIMIIVSILSFIFNKEHIGAILATIVLFGLVLLTPILFFINLKNAKSKRKNTLKINDIEPLVAEYQPNIDLDIDLS